MIAIVLKPGSAAYLPDTFILPKASNQLLAEPEKTQRWQAVVLKNDSLGLVVEEPSDGITDSLLAAKVFGSEECFHLTGPIDLCNDPSHLVAFSSFLGQAPRAIGRDIEPFRPGLADHVEDA
jgi:hypothetical protein